MINVTISYDNNERKIGFTSAGKVLDARLQELRVSDMREVKMFVAKFFRFIIFFHIFTWRAMVIFLECLVKRTNVPKPGDSGNFCIFLIWIFFHHLYGFFKTEYSVIFPESNPGYSLEIMAKITFGIV